MQHTRLPVALIALVLVAAACSGSEGSSDGPTLPTAAPSVMVPQDLDSPIFVANVQLTDDGFDPDMIFVPAGRQVRLVLRNRGSHEHHYRVAGLIASEIRWLMEPDVDEEEIDNLLADNAGFTDDDVEHILHHMTPSYVPFKDASLSGIKPLRNEVHGYAQAGQTDVLTFYPLATGKYEVEDVRYPEFTGTFVVFDPRPPEGS